MRDRVERLLAEIGDVVDEEVYMAEGNMTCEELAAHNRREWEAGRWQAMSARHHASMALCALEAGDEALAAKRYTIALEAWAAALTRVKHAGKQKRLSVLPDQRGRRATRLPERLYRAARGRVQSGVSISRACAEAVADDALLKNHYRNVSASALVKAYRRGEALT